MKLPWLLSMNEANSELSHIEDQKQAPNLNFEGKQYDLNSLPKDVKELVRGIQVADAQLRMQEDNLKMLSLGRQALALQLKSKLEEIN